VYSGVRVGSLFCEVCLWMWGVGFFFNLNRRNVEAVFRPSMVRSGGSGMGSCAGVHGTEGVFVASLRFSFVGRRKLRDLNCPFH